MIGKDDERRQVVVRRSDAYTYLNKSVEDFPSGEALARLVRAAGFRDVEQVPLTFGIATLTLAVRDPSAAEVRA